LLFFFCSSSLNKDVVTISFSSELLTLLAYQRPAVKRIPAARPRKYQALCLISKNIPTGPMRPTRSNVRIPSLRKIIPPRPTRPMRPTASSVRIPSRRKIIPPRPMCPTRSNMRVPLMYKTLAIVCLLSDNQTKHVWLCSGKPSVCNLIAVVQKRQM
jgi:hypothetical protein